MSARKPIATPLIEALEKAWAEVQRRHKEVPDVVMITGSGADGRRPGLRLGSYEADAWQKGKGKLPEVFVGGEGFERGARDVLGTIIHEAAHAVAKVRKVQDTSRQGRYHNQRFKAIAEEMGLTIEKDPRIGWSLTTVPDETAKSYAAAIKTLEKALKGYTRVLPRRGPAKSTPPPCSCGCGRKIRVAPSVLEMAPIVCGSCEGEFTPEAAA